MIHNKPIGRLWRLLTSAGVFLFFSLTLAIPSGYSYGAALLLLTAFAFFFARPKKYLSYEDKILAYLLLSVFLTALGAFLIHQNQPKSFDQDSRYLLLVPILILLLHVPLAIRAIWASLIVSSFSALAIALWQYNVQGNDRPDGFMTSAIPFGNLSLMAGILCLAGITWANTQYRYTLAWKAALYAGFLAGLSVSLLSGSRGGWLAIPVVLILFFGAFAKKGQLKATAFSTFSLLIAISFAGIAMQGQITARYNAAVSEVHDYAISGNASTSVGIRLEAWRTAINSIAERPILGWSYDDYDLRLQELAAENRADASITALSNTHNNFLEVWLHQGLFGLLAFLALFIVPFWFFCKRLRSNDHTVQAFALGGACLLASFFVFGLTQVILGRNNGVIFFGLTLAIFWSCMRNAEQRAAAMLPSQ